MGVYIWTDSPLPLPYKYSYDFRNKTTTQLANDGWTNTSGLTVNSNGVTSSSWVAVFNNLSGLNLALNNAKKIILEATVVAQSGSWLVGGITICSDTNATHQTGGYYGSTYEVMADKGRISYGNGGATSGTYNIRCEYNFTTKQCIYYISNNVTSGTATISDSQISGIKECLMLRLVIQYYYIQTIKVTIE